MSGYHGIFAIDQDEKIIADAEPIDDYHAGDSPSNPYMIGLGYSLYAKFPDAISIDLYIGDYPNPSGANALMDRVLGSEYNWLNGVMGGEDDIISPYIDFQRQTPYDIFSYDGPGDVGEIHLRFRVHYHFGYRDYERKIFIQRMPLDIVLFGPAQLPSIPPYPTLINKLNVPVVILPEWKNEEGVKKFGGMATVQVYDTAGLPLLDEDYPCEGPFLASGWNTGQRGIGSLSSIDLYRRTGDNQWFLADEVFITPPGYPDFSGFFYFITFRFRAKSGSSIYLDFFARLFLGRNCAPLSVGPYLGYDSSGIEMAVPVLDPLSIYCNDYIESFDPGDIIANYINYFWGNYNIMHTVTAIKFYKNLTDTAQIFAFLTFDRIGGVYDSLYVYRDQIPEIPFSETRAAYVQFVEGGPNRLSNRYLIEFHTINTSVFGLWYITSTVNPGVVTIWSGGYYVGFVIGRTYNLEFYFDTDVTTPYCIGQCVATSTAKANLDWNTTPFANHYVFVGHLKIIDPITGRQSNFLFNQTITVHK